MRGYIRGDGHIRQSLMAEADGVLCNIRIGLEITICLLKIGMVTQVYAGKGEIYDENL